MPKAADPTPTSAALGFGTPFDAQLTFFKNKLNLPTEQWDDIMNAAHDRAFIVAGVAKADLLQDLRDAVGSTMASGGGLNEFRRKFKDVVASHGWTGWTGEGSAQGEAWRTRVIYQTNMATSYAAGRYQQMTEPSFAAVRPFWKYVHADGVLHPRPLHMAWNGITLPKDHPFWQTHFAPNGWGCRCEIHPVKAPAPGAPGLPDGWDKIDPTTGAPVGIDRGFAYAPGANAATPLRSLVDQKLINLQAPVGAQMWQALKPAMAMERQAAWWQTLDAWLASEKPLGRTALVGAMDGGTLDALGANGLVEPANAAIEIRDGLVLGTKQARHKAAQDGLTEADWRALPSVLDTPDAIYRDAATGKLIYVADGIGPTKVIVEFEPSAQAGIAGSVVSAFRTSAVDVAGMVKGARWVPLK